MALISFREAKRALWSTGLGEGSGGRGGGVGSSADVVGTAGDSAPMGAEEGRLRRGEGTGVKARFWVPALE